MDRFWQGKTWYLRDPSDPPLFPGKLPSLLSLSFFGVTYLQHIALIMSAHSSKSSESDIKSIKTLLKQVAKDFQSLSYRQLEHKEQIKELEMVKERDEYSNKSKRSSHASSSKRVNDSFGERNLKTNDYYQPPPRRARKERQENPKEIRVELPHFYGKENVETYLDWEMKVE